MITTNDESHVLSGITHLLFEQVLACTTQTLAPLLDVSQTLEHLPHLALSLFDQLDQPVALLSQPHNLREVVAIERILLVLGREGQCREMIEELLGRGDRGWVERVKRCQIGGRAESGGRVRSG
jgi:hypothetical protein